MHLERVFLRNFRSYEKEEILFDSHVNLIQGRNAEGKTNLLEAIYLLSTGRSFRTLKLTDLILEGSAFFYLEADFIKEGISQSLKLSFDGQEKKMQYNATAYQGFLNLLGLLPSVIYAPEDISLIMGAPTQRRRYLDLHLAQIDPLYVYHLTRFFKAMKQRNVLLRKKTTQSIEVWEETMAHSALYVMEKRALVLQDLKTTLNEAMQTLSENCDHLEVKYLPSFSGDLQKIYTEQRHKEMLCNATLFGPHRDDFVILINEKTAKSYASEGQKQCAILSFRLAEWKRLASFCSEAPLMSIDDFGVHLDAKRRSLLEEELENLGQIFCTSPDFSASNQKVLFTLREKRVWKETPSQEEMILPCQKIDQ